MLDINMPYKDGYETALYLKTNFPDIKILVLSMFDNELSIIKMLRNGAKGYILKDSEPEELSAAIDAVLRKGYYYSDLVSGKLVHAINKMDDNDNGINEFVKLTPKELEFLKHVCSELTYKEIAEKMHLSPRTVEGYRDQLFFKLNLKTRVGLVLYAIKNGIVIV
jgi:two-component system, NarL family, invasion response regulator UvrY